MRTEHVILHENGSLEALDVAEKGLEFLDRAHFHSCLLGALAARVSKDAWQEALDSALESLANYKARRTEVLAGGR